MLRFTELTLRLIDLHQPRRWRDHHRPVQPGPAVQELHVALAVPDVQHPGRSGRPPRPVRLTRFPVPGYLARLPAAGERPPGEHRQATRVAHRGRWSGACGDRPRPVPLRAARHARVRCRWRVPGDAHDMQRGPPRVLPSSLAGTLTTSSPRLRAWRWSPVPLVAHDQPRPSTARCCRRPTAPAARCGSRPVSIRCSRAIPMACAAASRNGCGRDTRSPSASGVMLRAFSV